MGFRLIANVALGPGTETYIVAKTVGISTRKLLWTLEETTITTAQSSDDDLANSTVVLTTIMTIRT